MLELQDKPTLAIRKGIRLNCDSWCTSVITCGPVTAFVRHRHGQPLPRIPILTEKQKHSLSQPEKYAIHVMLMQDLCTKSLEATACCSKVAQRGARLIGCKILKMSCICLQNLVQTRWYHKFKIYHMLCCTIGMAATYGGISNGSRNCKPTNRDRR